MLKEFIIIYPVYNSSNGYQQFQFERFECKNVKRTGSIAFQRVVWEGMLKDYMVEFDSDSTRSCGELSFVSVGVESLISPYSWSFNVQPSSEIFHLK